MGYETGYERQSFMARAPRGERMYLEQHNGKWRVTLSVPARLQKAMGATKIKRALGTDSLSLANQLKWAVIKDLKDVIRSFERNGGSDVSRGARNVALRQAADIAMALRAYAPEHHLELSRNVVDGKVYEILGSPIRYDVVEEGYDVDPSDVGTRIPVYDPALVELADDFVAVALHGKLPIACEDENYKKNRLRVSPRAELHHLRQSGDVVRSDGAQGQVSHS